MKKILITGASGGIGLEVARQLAAEGNLITLVARKKESLEAVMNSLPGKGHKFLAADLSKKEDVHVIADHLSQNHYDVLINNAGVGMYGRFDTMPFSEQVAMMNLNMYGLTKLAYSFIRNAKSGDSLVNIASTLGSTAFPGQAVYSATKAYVTNLSDSLWWENKGKGIYVLGFCPGVTHTNFHTASGGSDDLFPNFIAQSSSEVAGELIRALKKRKKSKVVSGKINRFMLFFHRFLSRKSVVNMMGGFSPLDKKAESSLVTRAATT